MGYHKCSIHHLLPLGTKVCSQCEFMPKGSKVGKVRSDKKLETLTLPIGKFMGEYYIPMLEKCAYHIPHVKILSRKECGAMRQEAHANIPYSFATGHDYTERLTPNYDFEIQGDHFSKDRSLSMEGYGVSIFDPTRLGEFDNGTISENELKSYIRKEYHSFFSDDSKQDAVTTYSNMEKLFLKLFEQSAIKKGSTNFDNTDGCAKQYRCGTALFMLTVLAKYLDIIIDQAIGAPGHGKSEIDGLMAVDKVFLRSLFRMIIIPEEKEETNRFSAATVKEGKETSLASQCALACCDLKRVNGVKSNKKYSKREDSNIFKSRTYYESKRSDVQCKDVKFVVADGFEKGPKNGLAAMYNLRADPELGVGKIAVRRIPCACDGCLSRFKLPINERYKGSCTECKYYQIFLETNNWRVVTLKARKDCPEEDLEEAKMIVLNSMTENAANEIKVGNIGAFSTEDPTYEGFYLVKWTSESFPAEEDTLLHDFDPPMHIKKGDLLVTAKYLDKVPRAANWWCPIEQTVTVRVQQVLATKIQLMGHCAANQLPRTCNNSEAIRLNSKKLCEEDREKILHEILVRNVLDFEERGKDGEDISAGSLEDLEDLLDTEE